MSVTNDDVAPVTARGRATRDRIVSCAADLMLTQGLTSFSLEKVRHGAAVSGSQLTHYFVDKDALIQAVILRQTEVMLDFHRQPALGNLDTFEDFEQWVELTMKYSRRRIRNRAMPTYGALAGQLSKYDEQARELLADGYRQWVALLRRGVARMKKNGLLVEAADPAMLANVLVSAHQGGTLIGGAYGATWPDRESLTFAVNYLRQFAADEQDKPRAAAEASGRRVATSGS
jgi:AcrR family transcriptional regulator